MYDESKTALSKSGSTLTGVNPRRWGNDVGGGGDDDGSKDHGVADRGFDNVDLTETSIISLPSESIWLMRSLGWKFDREMTPVAGVEAEIVAV